MKVPFMYGLLAEKENFIDRFEERKQLKSFLGGGINVMLISPRRWGKSSLVKAAMEELKEEDSQVRVCYLDASKIHTVEEFYNRFATSVIGCASSTLEKRWADFKQYVQALIPGIRLRASALDSVEVEMEIEFQHLKDNAEAVLQLPEQIAVDKEIHIIVCIDEFQQLATLSQWKHMEATMRSVWQQHHHANYCLYGSKRHMMMDIFGNSSNPFYRFGQVIFMKKIEKEYWIPYIKHGFEKTGKSIGDDFASRICDVVECHSWYVQQFSLFLWTNTDDVVTEDIFNRQLQVLIDTNADMFSNEIENLASSQIAMLRAVAAGETKLNAKDVVERYHLGAPRTITLNKKVLVNRDIIEQSGSTYRFVDPVYELWFKREYL
ncbi:MAG: ATP-binding protein [Bacteroidales bacterium]|nr:ATP-binding protein [Bacteroidales bacterium]